MTGYIPVSSPSGVSGLKAEDYEFEAFIALQCVCCMGIAHSSRGALPQEGAKKCIVFIYSSHFVLSNFKLTHNSCRNFHPGEPDPLDG
jgi:hypothetical protein